MQKFKKLRLYGDLVKYSTLWSIEFNRTKLFFCIIKGVMATVFLYASLVALALIAQSLQELFFDSTIPPITLLSELNFQLLVLGYLVLSALSAFLQRSFYRSSYQIWANQSSWASQTFLENVKELPNPKFSNLNRFILDKVELMRNASGRPRALGAFGHYLRIMFLEVFKVTVFGLTLIVMAPKFTGVIFLCFLVFTPWVIHAHKMSANLSQEIESQQKTAAVERNVYLDQKNPQVGHLQTQKFFSLLTENYLQAKSNQLYSSLANIFAVVLVLFFVLFSANEGDYQFSYWLAIIILGRLLAASVMQLSASLILMSRQAPLAKSIKHILEQFEYFNSQELAPISISDHGNEQGSASKFQIFWLYQNRVVPNTDHLNAMLYLVDKFNFEKESNSIIFDSYFVEANGDNWLSDFPKKGEELYERFMSCIKACEFKHLEKLVKDGEKIGGASDRAAKIQFLLTKNIIDTHRVFVSNSLLWAIDLSKVNDFLEACETYLFVYFSESTFETFPPPSNAVVLEYCGTDVVKINRGFTASSSKNSASLSEMDLVEFADQF